MALKDTSLYSLVLNYGHSSNQDTVLSDYTPFLPLEPFWATPTQVQSLELSKMHKQHQEGAHQEVVYSLINPLSI